MVDFASQLRLTRDLLGWRQYRIAEAFGVHANTISKWEMGIQEPSRRHERMLVILAERNGLVLNERGYPEYVDNRRHGT